MKALFLLLTLLVSVVSFASDDVRKKIVVVDTPISDAQLTQPYMCKDGSISMDKTRSSHFGPNEQNVVRHGENVVGLIGSRIDTTKYCILHIAFYFKQDQENYIPLYLGALLKIEEYRNVVGINLSLAASKNVKGSYLKEESYILRAFAISGVKIITAAGNSHEELTKKKCFVYPACTKKRLSSAAADRFYIVGSNTFYMNSDGSPHEFSNFSYDLDIELENGVNQGVPAMNGTSQATAIFTGKLFSR